MRDNENRVDVTMDTCPICNRPSTSATPFCDVHVKGWILSDERKNVDFYDNTGDSYFEQVVNYAERIVNAPIIEQDDSHADD